MIKFLNTIKGKKIFVFEGILGIGILLAVYNILGMGCVMLLLIPIGIIIFSCIIKKSEYYKYQTIIRQLSVILALLTCFFVEAAFSDAVAPKDPLQMIAVCGLTISSFLAAFFIGYQDFIKIITSRKMNENIRVSIIFKLKKIMYNNKEISVVLLISFLLRSFMLNNMQKWDGAQYYAALGNACRSFDFTLISFFNNFRLASHPTLGFAPIMALGEYLNIGGINGYMIVNLILTLVAIFYCYQLFEKYWAHMSKKQAALGAFLVSVNPLFLGTFSYVNVDYSLVIFFIFMVTMEFKKKYLLMAFWGLVVVQTKETGLVILTGYYGLRLVALFWSHRGSIKDKCNICIKDPINCWGLVPFVSYICYMIKIKGVSSWNLPSYAHSFTNTAVHDFGFEPTYMLYKMQQLFIINFSWILALILVIGVITLPILYKKKIRYEKSIAGLIGIGISYCIFSCIYITYTTHRYNIIFPVLLMILSYIVLQQLLRSIKKYHLWNQVMVSGLAILFLIQSFITIDPVSNKVFTTVETGSIPMLYTMKDYTHYGDGLIHNYQYTYIDKLFDKMLSEVGYNSNMYIMNAGAQGGGMQVNGNGTAYTVNWDPKKGRRVFGNQKGSIPINVYTTFELFHYLPYYSEYDSSKIKDIPDNAVVYFMPYYEEDEKGTIEGLSEYYFIGDRQTIKNIQGEIIFYQLIKKDNYKGHSIYEYRAENESYNIEEKEQISYGNIVEAIYQNTIDKFIFQAELEERKYEVGYEIRKEGDYIEKGDIVAFTCRSFLNGEEIPNLEISKVMGVNNIQEVIGGGKFIEGFEENLIGLKEGEKKVFTCKIPDEYAVYPQYEGTEIEFMVDIRDISGHIVLPELTEESISLFTNDEVNLEQFLNAAMLEASGGMIEDFLENIAESVEESAYTEDALYIETGWIKEYYRTIFASNITGNVMEEWQMPWFVEQYMGMSYEEYEAYIITMAKTVLKEQVIQKIVCRQENIIVSNDLVDVEYKERYQEKETTALENINKYLLKDTIEREKAVQSLLKYIQVS